LPTPVHLRWLIAAAADHDGLTLHEHEVFGVREIVDRAPFLFVVGGDVF
jgi:hypothetical protein